MGRTRTFLAVVLLLAPVLSSVPARAASCYPGARPAATLLLPYFEVDLVHEDGRTTLFSVANASDRAVLTNVVVWTDLGVPSISFPVYLTGYDVQTFNLRDLFAGRVPATAPAGQDPKDTISPRGPQSQDADYPSCAFALPPGGPLSAAVVAHLRAAHTGGSSPIWNACAGRPFGDGVARGYVTVDTVRACSPLVPGDAGYFGPGGVATADNVLWGDFFYVDGAASLADGEGLVRIQADPAAYAGKPTFYGRYVNGTGADGRQPLPPDWAARFLSSGAFTEGTDLVVWRDSGAVTRPFPCGHPPSWFPLVVVQYVAFDEEENPFIPPTFPIPEPPPRLPAVQAPAEANRFRVGSENDPVPFDFGWIYLHLGHSVDFGRDFATSQGWVGTTMKAGGRFSVGFGATPLSSGCDPAAPLNF